MSSREEYLTQREEVAVLRNRIASLEAELEQYKKAMVICQDRNARVCAENTQLEAALRKYGDHTIACASRRGHFKGPQYECDCGWTKALLANFALEK